MKFTNDIVTNGREILERELTEKEVKEIEEAMQARYEMYCEDFNKLVDVDTLFNEDFYDILKIIISEMMHI